MREEIYHFNQSEESRELIKFTICGTTHPDKNYRISREHSSVFCIEYIESGTGSVKLQKTSFSPSEGDSYFLHQGEAHLYYSDAERPWKKHFINFSGRLPQMLMEGYGLSNEYYFKGLDLKRELLEIIDLGMKHRDDCTAELIGILNRILFKMYTYSKGEPDKNDISHTMRMFLDAHITSKIKIDDLCRHVSRSESQTIRIFKNAYGTTPYAYLLSKRIGLAKRLLRDTSLSVREISEELCFVDEYYFSNIFKQKEGVTPSAYRKEQRK